MHAHSQETQEEINRVTMEKDQTAKEKSKSNSSFKNIKSGGVLKKPTEPLKDATNVLPVETNIVRIKSKNSENNVSRKDQELKQKDEAIITPLTNEGQSVKQMRCKKITSKSKANSSVKQFKTSKLVITPKQFLLKSVESTEVAKCSISCQNGFFSDVISIRLQGNTSQLVTYESKFSLSGYEVVIKLPDEEKEIQAQSCDQSECFSQKSKNPNIAILRSNFSGSMFNVYEINEIQQEILIASIEYDSEIGKSVVPRKVTIYYQQKVPEAILNNFNESVNLKTVYQKEGMENGLKVFQSDPPVYDEEKGIYCVKFESKKSVLPSVHNIVLKNSEDQAVLKLLKIEENQYYLECFNPISPIIGCAFSISSFLFKLASQ